MQRTCTQLYAGRLWKCPAVAYFDKLDEKLGGVGEEWEPFRRYEGLGGDATADQVREFFEDVPIDQCRLCPSTRIPHPHPDPTSLPVI